MPGQRDDTGGLSQYVFADGAHVAVGTYRPLSPDFNASHESHPATDAKQPVSTEEGSAPQGDQ